MRMNQDRLMREVTGTSKNAGIEEIGVFYAPPIDFGRPVSTAGLPEGEEYAASDEWFSNADLETHFSEESRITALLPQGHAKRLDIDPRILTFEHLRCRRQSRRGPMGARQPR